MKEICIEEVAKVIGEVVPLSPQQVQADAVLGEDIMLDSQEMLRVVSRLEALFKMRFEPRRLLRIRTLGDLTDALRADATL